MHIENLVNMINKIETFYRSEPVQADAVEGIRNHVRRFWEPRMRKAIIAHLESGGAGLGELSAMAVKLLADEAAAAA
jgi:formate dehydrogenase subunit delta